MSDSPSFLSSSKTPRRVAAAIVVACVLGTVIWGGLQYRKILNYPNTRPNTPPSTSLGGDKNKKIIDIPRGAGLRQVIAQLEREGILGEGAGTAFKLFVLHKGAANQIKAGEHPLHASMTPSELLQELLRRPPAPVFKITIPEGKHMLDVAQIVAKAGGPSESEMLAAMRDPEFLRELDIDRPSAEGYLFPDTYQLQKKESAKAVVKKLVSRHHQVYAKLERENFQASRRLQKEFGWSQPEVVTLASIVEKETGAAFERPLIAGVFLNRLRFDSFQPKLLQTDPTIIYGCILAEPKSQACRSFEGRIRRIHLRDKDNVYNTYTHTGLPPGPISNPGRAALEAVFSPKKSRFLYFVSKNNGTHKFSATRAEHEAAVERHMRQGVVGDG